eukprot:189847-Chlamydomonas_euryale.AAC.2
MAPRGGCKRGGACAARARAERGAVRGNRAAAEAAARRRPERSTPDTDVSLQARPLAPAACASRLPASGPAALLCAREVRRCAGRRAADRGGRGKVRLGTKLCGACLSLGPSNERGEAAEAAAAAVAQSATRQRAALHWTRDKSVGAVTSKRWVRCKRRECFRPARARAAASAYSPTHALQSGRPVCRQHRGTASVGAVTPTHKSHKKRTRGCAAWQYPTASSHAPCTWANPPSRPLLAEFLEAAEVPHACLHLRRKLKLQQALKHKPLTPDVLANKKQPDRRQQGADSYTDECKLRPRARYVGLYSGQAVIQEANVDTHTLGDTPSMVEHPVLSLPVAS